MFFLLKVFIFTTSEANGESKGQSLPRCLQILMTFFVIKGKKIVFTSTYVLLDDLMVNSLIIVS